MRGVLWLAVILVCPSAPSFADDDDDERDRDDPPTIGHTVIVVTGLRLPRPRSDLPAAITVIERAEIERSPRRSADDLVRGLPSVATFRRSSSLIADPTSQGVNLRGLGPSGVSRALVLWDGIPVNDPFGGWIYWRSIPLHELERIEVVPSGASALFGNFALGGVVDLVSRPIEPGQVDGLLATGSLRTHRASARAADQLGALAVAADAEVVESAGYAPIAAEQRGPVDGRAASAHVSAGTRLELARGRSHWRLRARYFDQSLDAGTLHTSAQVRAAGAAAAWTHLSGAGELRARLFAGEQWLLQQRARVDQDRAAAEPSSRQQVPSSSQGAALTWTAPAIAAAGQHVLLIGVDGTRVTGTATDRLFPPDPAADSVVERSAGGEQRFLGLFVQDGSRLPGAVELSAALRVDLQQDRAGRRTTLLGSGEQMTRSFPARTDVQVNPRLGVLHRLPHGLGVRASGYRAFRAPTLNELYRPFQVGTVLTEANENLRAETLWGAELGPELAGRRFTLRATGFWNRLDQPINNVTLAEPLPSGASRQRQNLGRARVRGVELEGGWRPAAGWQLTAGYTFVDARVTSAPEHPDLIGKRLAQDPRHRASAGLGFADPAIATITAQARYLGGQFEDDLNTLPMGGFVLVDALASRRLGRGVSLFTAVENLFDRRYLVGRAGVDTTGQPRAVHVGLQLAAH